MLNHFTTGCCEFTDSGVSRSWQSSSEVNNGPSQAPPYPGVPPSGIPPPFVSQWQTCLWLLAFLLLFPVVIEGWYELVKYSRFSSMFHLIWCLFSLFNLMFWPDGTTWNTASFPSNGNAYGTATSQHDSNASWNNSTGYNATNGGTSDGTG